MTEVKSKVGSNNYMKDRKQMREVVGEQITDTGNTGNTGER